jgi:hypothetical protein
MSQNERGTVSVILEERSNCPKCGRPVSEHFTLPLTDEEFRTWDQNALVCELTRGEVRTLQLGDDEE